MPQHPYEQPPYQQQPPPPQQQPPSPRSSPRSSPRLPDPSDLYSLPATQVWCGSNEAVGRRPSQEQLSVGNAPGVFYLADCLLSTQPLSLNHSAAPTLATLSPFFRSLARVPARARVWTCARLSVARWLRGGFLSGPLAREPLRAEKRRGVLRRRPLEGSAARWPHC
jgi:hypothetical protein